MHTGAVDNRKNAERLAAGKVCKHNKAGRMQQCTCEMQGDEAGSAGGMASMRMKNFNHKLRSLLLSDSEHALWFRMCT